MTKAAMVAIVCLILSGCLSHHYTESVPKRSYTIAETIDEMAAVDGVTDLERSRLLGYRAWMYTEHAKGAWNDRNQFEHWVKYLVGQVDAEWKARVLLILNQHSC